MLALAAAGLVACGEDGPGLSTEPLPEGPPRVAAAAVANRLIEALTLGDGDSACELMTERGRTFFVRVGRSTGVAGEGDDCADVVAAIDRDRPSEIESFKPSDVSIGASQLPGAEPGVDRYAEIGCEFRGSLGLERLSEGWRVFMPACFD